MKSAHARSGTQWARLGPRFLPFADAATTELPLARLIRLSLFQVSVGMAMVLLTGTLNRVMIVELGVPASLVAMMVSLPLVFAPLRALIGHRSDTYRSFLGWRRVPYIWMGTMLQFGGLAIMPFALLVLSGDSTRPGLSRPDRRRTGLPAGRRRPAHHPDCRPGACQRPGAGGNTRPRVVALLYVMLLVGMVAARLFRRAAGRISAISGLSRSSRAQPSLTWSLNIVALWKQEARNPSRTATDRAAARLSARPGAASRASPREAAAGHRGARHRRLHHAGRAAGALRRPDSASRRGATTMLTALLARRHARRFRARRARLSGGSDPYRLAALGALAGLPAFSADLRGAARLRPAIPHRYGADRLRRRPVRRRHA